MPGIDTYLDVIKNESDGETVVTAVINSLSELSSDEDVVSQNIDISDELNVIEWSPHGRFVKRAIKRALYKLSQYDKVNRDVNVVLMAREEDYSYVEEHPETLCFVMSDATCGVIVMTQYGYPDVENNDNLPMLSESDFNKLPEKLKTSNHNWKLFMGKYAPVSNIGNTMFSNIANLESVSVYTKNLDIGSNSFAGCRNLKDVHIGQYVRSIGDSAFLMCTSLQTITIRQPQGSISGAPWGAPEGTEIIWSG